MRGPLQVPRRLAFAALAVLVVAAAIQVGWRVAFARIRDDGRLAAWTNSRPQRLRVAWREVRSPYPGRIEVDGLRVAGRTARLRWEVTAEVATGWLSPTPLLRRELAFTGIRARGVRVQVETSERAEGPAGGGPQPPPRIPDFGAGPLPPRAVSAHPWSYGFRDLEVERLEEVRFDDRRFTGSARGQGGFTLERRRDAEILPTLVTLRDVGVDTAGGRVASGVGGTLRFRVAKYPYHGVTPADLLPRFRGEIDLDGELDAEAALAYLARGWPSLEFEGGISRVSTRLRLDHSRFQPGSHLELQADRQILRFLGFEARGSARLGARVEGGLGPPRLSTELQLGDWELGRPGAAGVIFGDGLRLTASAVVPNLLQSPERGELEVDLGHARIPDLRFLNDFLPAAAGLQVERGEVAIAGALRFTAAAGEGGGGGKLEVRGKRLHLDARGQRLAGDLEADLHFSDPDLVAGRFSLAGTKLAIRGLSAETSGGAALADWWGDVTLTGGRVDLRPPLSLSGDFTAKLADTRPLIAFYEIRRDLSDWTERLLTLEGPSATGSFRWSPGRFELERGFVPLKNGELRARFLLEGGESRGKLLARWRRLVLGIGLAGGQRSVRLRDVEGWFAADGDPVAAP